MSTTQPNLSTAPAPVTTFTNTKTYVATAIIVAAVIVVPTIILGLGSLKRGPQWLLPPLLAIVITIVVLSRLLVIRLVLDRSRQTIQLGKIFGYQTVPWADIQSCTIIMVNVAQKLGRWYIWGRQLSVRPYIELVTSNKTILYPFPISDGRGDRATLNYISSFFRPVFEPRYQVKHVEFSYLFVPPLAKAYWRYYLAGPTL